MGKQSFSEIDGAFAQAFLVAWEKAVESFADCGLVVGAVVRNKNGEHFRLTRIEPSLYNFDGPSVGVVCYGVKYRADDTWGTHKHWAGNIDDLTVDSCPTPEQTK